MIYAAPNIPRAGVVAGFVLGLAPGSLIPTCTRGVLFAQGMMYRPESVALPAMDANARQWLFYGSTGGFYWADTFAPGTPGDAFVGWARASASQVVAVARQAFRVGAAGGSGTGGTGGGGAPGSGTAPAVTPAPMVIGFGIGDGSIGTNVADLAMAPRDGVVSKCKIVTKAADSAVDLTLDIQQNGASVFGTVPTVAHATAAGTVSTFTTLTSVPLAVAEDDVFSLDIASGSDAWKFTVQLES